MGYKKPRFIWRGFSANKSRGAVTCLAKQVEWRTQYGQGACQPQTLTKKISRFSQPFSVGCAQACPWDFGAMIAYRRPVVGKKEQDGCGNDEFHEEFLSRLCGKQAT